MNITPETIFTNSQEITDQISGDATQSKRMKVRILAISGFMIYGFAMGIEHSILQAVSSAIKLPLLFLLSFLITLPAFHFISLHLGSRLTFRQTVEICTYGASITAVLAAAFSPILLFFSISGSGYAFLILANVAILGFCASAGATTIYQALASERAKRDIRLGVSADFCFPAWIAILAIVGTQMAYLMRPFVGSGDEFVLINQGGGNFFEAIFKTLLALLTGS